MKCILEPTFDTPLVSFHISNRLGTAAEPFGSEGLVYHTAEMGFRGASFLGRNEFDEKVDSLGASLSIGTHRDYLDLRGTCLLRHLDTLFDLRDDDASVAYRFLNRYLHPGYVYCRTALGTEKSLGTITLDQSRDLHSKLFRHSDLILGVAGPIDDARLATLASRLPQDTEPEASHARDSRQRRLVLRRQLLHESGAWQAQFATDHGASCRGLPGCHRAHA